MGFSEGFHTSVPCALIKSDFPFSTLPPKPFPISIIYYSTFKSNTLPCIEKHDIYYVSSLLHLKQCLLLLLSVFFGPTLGWFPM